MEAVKTSDLTLGKRVELVLEVLGDTIKCQEAKRNLAETQGDGETAMGDWLRAKDMIDLCQQLREILNGEYDIVDCGIECEAISKQEVAEAFGTIKAYCKARDDRDASCLGCPVRKPYGTRKPDGCRLNYIDRPSNAE